MKVIKAYESDTGKVFTEKAEALLEDAKFELDSFLEDKGVCSGGAWDRRDITDFFLENAEKLNMILSVIVQRQKEVDAS